MDESHPFPFPDPAKAHLRLVPWGPSTSTSRSIVTFPHLFGDPRYLVYMCAIIVIVFMMSSFCTVLMIQVVTVRGICVRYVRDMERADKQEGHRQGMQAKKRPRRDRARYLYATEQ